MNILHDPFAFLETLRATVAPLRIPAAIFFIALSQVAFGIALMRSIRDHSRAGAMLSVAAGGLSLTLFAVILSL